MYKQAIFITLKKTGRNVDGAVVKKNENLR